MIKGVSLQLTRRCNSKCSHCFGDYGPNTKGELTLDQAKYYIDQLPEHKTYLLNLTGGEPTLYDELIEVIEYASKTKKQFKYPQKIQMITNGKWARNNDLDFCIETFEKAGLDNLAFSIGRFRSEKQNKTSSNVCNYLKLKNNVIVNNSTTSLFNKIIPIRRGYDVPIDSWYNRRDSNNEIIEECPLDEWALHLKGEKRKNSAFVSPTGLYLCDWVPEVIKIGELGESLSIIEPRVRKIGKFIRTLAAFDPSVVAKKINEHYLTRRYGFKISTEHDCISCQQMFDKYFGYEEIEMMIKNKWFEKVVDELMNELDKDL